jgi:hypothetical protein
VVNDEKEGVRERERLRERERERERDWERQKERERLRVLLRLECQTQELKHWLLKRIILKTPFGTRHQCQIIVYSSWDPSLLSKIPQRISKKNSRKWNLVASIPWMSCEGTGNSVSTKYLIRIIRW